MTWLNATGMASEVQRATFVVEFVCRVARCIRYRVGECIRYVEREVDVSLLCLSIFNKYEQETDKPGDETMSVCALSCNYCIVLTFLCNLYISVVAFSPFSLLHDTICLFVCIGEMCVTQMTL